MTIIIPKDYHAQKALENNRVICLTETEAERMDIRALRIGILNIMPEAQSYEFLLLNPLGRTVLQIIPVWIKLRSHTYNSSNRGHLERLYHYFDEVQSKTPLDGMIITGAPVEKMEYKDVRYWPEIEEILNACRTEIPKTMGICWGGLALANMLGIEKENYDEKMFGVFETFNLNPTHEITGGLDDVFWLPQSRHAGISDKTMESARDQGLVNLLAYSENIGYPIFESFDKRFIMNLGHFEYEAERLIEEMKRDSGSPDVKPPLNIDLQKPLNRWRGQRNEFFSQFVRCCYELAQTGN